MDRVECKTATCKIEMKFPDTVSIMKVQQTLAVLYSPGAGSYVGNGDFVLAYRAGSTWLRDVPDDDPSALFSAIEARRKEHLRAIKSDAKAGQPTTYKHLNGVALAR